MPSWFQTAPTGPTSGVALAALIVNITNWIFAGFMALALVFLVLAGWQFISSQGDPQGVGQARQKLLWAAVAVAAAVLSRGIVAAIRAIAGA